jgi:hypothetical protein
MIEELTEATKLFDGFGDDGYQIIAHSFMPP